jgi:hypothetical protein
LATIVSDSIAKKLRAAQLKRVRDDNAVNINAAKISGATPTTP